MLRRIVAAFDGSDLAREAFAYAATLAERTGASIVGLFVREPITPPPLAADAAPGVDPGPAIAELTIELEQLAQERERAALEGLEEFAEHCRKRGVAFEKRLRDGPLLTTLLREAGEEDLLAVGRKGRFSRAGAGSTTKALVKKAPCPVLVAQGPLRPVNRVLAVYDGHGPSAQAVRWARELAAQAKWPLTTLAAPCDGLTLDEALQEAQRLAGDEAQVIAFGQRQEREAALIEHAAEQAGAYALLVMGAYEHSLLRELLLGSETAAALNRVDGPMVLVHRAAATDQAAERA